MNLKFFKYQGAGNDFVIIDNRTLFFDKQNIELIAFLCNRRFGIGADGLMLLENSDSTDFKMIYYNSDGKEGSMCGNGGRCIVAFAHENKLFQQTTSFEAMDGMHSAQVLSKEHPTALVRLKMSDVYPPVNINNGHVLNTGSPHYVQFFNEVDSLDVYNIGKQIRYDAQYGEQGVNVNFVSQLSPNQLQVRTYERGVEDETYSCGTGVTASAIVAYTSGLTTSNDIQIKTKGGDLRVSFVQKDDVFTEVYLQGDATLVFTGTINI